MKRVLVIASRNQHKVAEIRALLHDIPLSIVSVAAYEDVPDVLEDQDTFEANAVKKAIAIQRATGCLTLADDSGLEVEALQGRPGVCSARYAGEPSNDANNNRKLLQELAEIPYEQRTARFYCVMALADPAGKVITRDGVLTGVIGDELRGDQGFGYDPLFLVPEYGKTLAELGERVKNQISHRAVALAGIRGLLHMYHRKC